MISSSAAPGRLEQRPQAGSTAARSNAPQSLRDEDAIVEIQRHDIGHGAECHEIEQVGRIGLRSGGKQAVVPQPAGQRGHHVESDADAGQRLRCEPLAGKVRIHDRRGIRQRRPGQVVIRDQHLDAEAPGLRDSFERRDPVVDGDDQLRSQLCGNPHDLRREPVAELEPVRHEELRIRETEAPQLADDDRGAGRAVRIEVTDHEDRSAIAAALQQQVDRGLDPAQRADRQQALEAEVEIRGVTHASRAIDAPQDRVQ